MQKKILRQLESLGFTLQFLHKTKWDSVEAGSFSDPRGELCLLFYPKPFAAPWPQWIQALDDSRHVFQLIRSSNRKVIVQISTQSDMRDLLLEISNKVRSSSEKYIFTPEHGFSQSQNKKKGFVQFIAPAITFGSVILLGLVLTPTAQEKMIEPKTEGSSVVETAHCLAELEDEELQKQTIALLSELKLPAFSEGSINLETKNEILEISPEQTIGGMTLLTVQISCIENDRTQNLRFRSDVRTKGEIRIVEEN
jgi:hypothetical protein